MTIMLFLKKRCQDTPRHFKGKEETGWLNPYS